MTQKPSKPIEARAIGLGLTPKLIDRLKENGILLVDAAALERLRSLVEEKPIENAVKPLPFALEGMSTYDAAKFLGIKEATLMGYASAGYLGFRAQKGKRMVYRFHKEELIAFLKRSNEQ